jgi:hypothetical protein
MKNGWLKKTLADVCEIKPPKSEARERVAADTLVSFAPMEDLGIESKLQFVDVVDYLAKIVTALNLVLNLAEDFADFVFDCVWTGCFLLEALERGKELLINEVSEVVTGHRFVVIEFPVGRFRRGPLLPAIWLFENEVVFATVQLGLSRSIFL